jgi:quinolinate synthase
MAETAAILNPSKKVLLPDLGAICPMAQQLTTEDLLKAKKKYPDAELVLYVNTLAEEKALADCTCTSANAPKIIEAMDAEVILFGPDRNLAYYAKQRSSKEVIPVPTHGYCPIHNEITLSDLLSSKESHPHAKIVVHPECLPEVQERADHIASTSGMVRFCKESEEKEFLIGTENGLLYRLNKEIPEKHFYPLSENAVCSHMKLHTIDRVKSALEEERYEVTVQKAIAEKARKTIKKMLELSR